MGALTYSFSEPYKLPAGVLALAVHGAFFVLLYFSISWQSLPPQGMVVDIWSSLSAQQPGPGKAEPTPASQAEPPKPARPQKPAKPVVLPKADIELADKNKPEIKPDDLVKSGEIQPVQAAIAGPVQTDQMTQAAQSAQGSGTQSGATGSVVSVVDEYRLKIIAKIRRNIAMPPAVPDSMRAEFNVTLAPDGSVLSVRLVKGSGSTVYDNAVERAISKAQPLPLPPDVSLFDRFRELHLIFRPKD